MSKIPQELIKEIVESQEFSSTEEVMQLTKEVFKNIYRKLWGKSYISTLVKINSLPPMELRRKITGMAIPRRV